jgi:predicted nucleic acid-binding protein
MMAWVKQGATLDSSFWVNAHRCGLLRYVLDLFDIWYAPVVAAELSEEFASGREFWWLVREGVLAEAIPRVDEIKAFGPGERAAMNLALEHPGRLLLVDDRRPLQEAQRLGIRTICTAVLLVGLFYEGRIDLRGALDGLARLAAMQTVSPTLIDAALAQLDVERRRKEN